MDGIFYSILQLVVPLGQMTLLLVVLTKFIIIELATSTILHWYQRWQYASSLYNVKDLVHGLGQGREVLVHWIVIVSTLILSITLISRVIRS